MSVTGLDRMLSTVETLLRNYVVLSSAQSCALALWVIHTHVVEAGDVTPYIAITSPEKRSGKTRLLEVLELLVPTPLRVANISEAALFRTIAEHRATLLLDEADALFNGKNEREDLRALVNAGYRRGAVVMRCEVEGKRIVPKRYDAYCAKAIAGIGQLPDTIADRSIPIRLQRKTRAEAVARFRFREVTEAGDVLRDALAGWSRDSMVTDTLREARPPLPDALDDRAQDGWEPLLAIADRTGESWPERARAAAVELHSEQSEGDESVGVLLLRHLRDAFPDGIEHRPTTELLTALCEREDGPWAAWWANDVDAGRTKGPAAKLARLLRPFAVEPRQIWTPGGKMRGYRAEDLGDLWERYVSPSTDSEVGRRVDRRSGGLFDPDSHEPNTPDDQASTDLPTSNTVEGG